MKMNGACRVLLFGCLLWFVGAATTVQAAVINVASESSQNEAVSHYRFTVSIDPDLAVGETVSIDYAVSSGSATVGDDFAATAGTIEFSFGNSSFDIDVPITDDDVVEGDKTFSFDLSNVSIVGGVTVDDYPASTPAIIMNDDYEVDAFADVTVDEGVGNATLQVVLNEAVTGDPVSFTVSVVGGTATGSGPAADYTAPSGTLQISSGTTGTITIPIIDDASVEFPETVQVRITPASGNVTVVDDVAELTISDNDKYVIAVTDASAVEGGNVEFTVTSSRTLQGEHSDLRITYQTADDTADSPEDYASTSGSLDFSSDLSMTVPVPTVADAIDEGAGETFAFTLGVSPSYAALVTFDRQNAVGTITDDDYTITPSWTASGTVTLQNPAIPISNGVPVVIPNGGPAAFAVAPLYGVTQVLVDGTPLSLPHPFVSVSGNTYQFDSPATPLTNHTFEVQFDHRISYSADGGGSVEAPDGHVVSGGGSDNYDTGHGTNADFIVSAGTSGTCVARVLLDGVSQGAFNVTDNWEGNAFPINNIQRDHVLNVTFGKATITVLLDAADGVSGSDKDLQIQNPVTGGSWRAYVTNSTYSIVPANLIMTGHHGDSFTIPDDIPVGNPCDVRYIRIQYDEVDGWLRPPDVTLNLQHSFVGRTLTGSYDPNTYNLTLVYENGTITADPLGPPAAGTVPNRYMYTNGSVVQLVPVPDTGWYFHGWQVDASGATVPQSVTMNRDKTIRAIFVQGCQDGDGDGYLVDPGDGSCDFGTVADCDDTNASIYPGAPEICGDGIDQDCSGGDLSCSGDDSDDDSDGFTENQGDCNDTDPYINPGAIDIPGDGIDQDCFDGDKEIGSELTCVSPSNVPVNASRKPAPPLIMFLLDDSGSMDWEFMTDASDQLFMGRYYVYDSHEYSRNYGIGYNLTDAQKRLWKSQWSGHNRIFFNPDVAYDPWPHWDEVAASIPLGSYVGAERMLVRPTERRYSTDNDSFPDKAFADGFVHADMDYPRNNTVDGNRGHAWSYLDSSGVAGRQTLELNGEFFRVQSAVDGQQVMVTRTEESIGSSTAADALGLSTRGDLQLSTPQLWTWYDTYPFDAISSNDAPRIIIDRESYSGRVTYSGSPYYVETDNWGSSGGESSYEWANDLRYTSNVGESAVWRLNLSAADATYCNSAGGCYLYMWVDEFTDRDNYAKYDIFYYNASGDLVADERFVDQSPGSGTSAGRRWVRIGNSRYNFRAQPVEAPIIIRNAHYFVWSDANANGEQDLGETYLINIVGSGHNVGDYSLEYYQFRDVNGNDRVDDGELLPLTNAADYAAVKPVRYYEDGTQIENDSELAYVVRQNFADWYSFYRRRMLTAKAAVGLTVADMERVELGIHTINRSVSKPLELMENAYSAEKIDYLKTIYDIDSSGSTYLRRGLDEVGRYFQEGDSGSLEVLKTRSGLPTGDNSVFWDANTDDDANDIDDSGGECQRAYVIAMTDGYNNEGLSYNLGNADGTSVRALRDNLSNTLADVAHRYYHLDLDSGLNDLVPARGFDDAAHQHMVTFGVSFGVSGLFDPDMFPDCLPSCNTPGSNGCPDLDQLGRARYCTTNASGEDECYICTWDSAGNETCADDPTTGPFRNVCPEWHNNIPSASPQTVDDLYHASVNGRGKFLNAADPAELVSSLKAIKDLIEENVGTASSVSINANKIETNTLLYQTSYDSGDWSGNVYATCLDRSGNTAACDKVECISTCDSDFYVCLAACDVGDEDCEEACNASWYNCYESNSCASYMTCSEAYQSCVEGCSGNALCLSTCDSALATCQDDPPEVKWVASEQLAGIGWNNRQIITATAGGIGLPFRWGDTDDSNFDGLTTSMKAVLDGDSLMLNYLRGDHSCVVGNTTGCTRGYRPRSNMLGDFINAEPYYFEDDSLGVKWVIAGANDGMLHVLNGDTGTEVFAYIPAPVFENLPELTEPTYNDSHLFFVDGFNVAQDLGQATLLVGGFGRGGKGFYGLDINAVVAGMTSSTIEDNAPAIVKWEYNTTTPNSIARAVSPTTLVDHLGYSYSRPQIIESNDKSDGAEWLLVFGNGYDSSLGRAVLFLVGLNTSGDIVWTHIIDTGEGDTGPNCNGLSTPAIIYPQGDGLNDFLFAGDLLGNMWKFDISDSNRSNWRVYFQDATAANPNKPLFTAKSDAGYRQPITMQPDVSVSCVRGAMGYFVTFGTGRLLNPEVDNLDLSIQTMYGIWDWSAEWGAQGANAEEMYLGEFLPRSSAVTSSCVSSCSALATECEVECLGNAECNLLCSEEEVSCINNCQGIRTLSNMNDILGNATGAQYVGLLRQHQVAAYGIDYNSDGTLAGQEYGQMNLNAVDEVVRIVSDNQINWLEPSEASDFLASSTKTAHHVGWYFDLPENGERAVKDVLIAAGRLIFTTSTPSNSPCSGGGQSYIWALNVCSGSRTSTAFFDLNNDGVIDQRDYINIGTEANPIWVAASSAAVGGIAPAPTLVEVEEGLDRLFVPDDDGENTQEGPPDVEGWGTPGFGIPIQYWRELDWQ